MQFIHCKTINYDKECIIKEYKSYSVPFKRQYKSTMQDNVEISIFVDSEM